MKYLQIALFVACIGVLSCSKDDSSTDCGFIGKWCVENTLLPGDCFPGTSIEFRSNGEVILIASSLKWKSNDCMTIDIFDSTGSTKGAEYQVSSITENKMTLDIGAGPTEYIKIQ